MSMMYARQGGVLQVADFSHGGQDLDLKVFKPDWEEWGQYVRGCLRPLMDYDLPKRYLEDVLVGPVYANHDEVVRDSRVLPKSRAALQFVAKSSRACDYMSSHTVAVFYDI